MSDISSNAPLLKWTLKNSKWISPLWRGLSAKRIVKEWSKKNFPGFGRKIWWRGKHWRCARFLSLWRKLWRGFGRFVDDAGTWASTRMATTRMIVVGRQRREPGLARERPIHRQCTWNVWIGLILAARFVTDASHLTIYRSSALPYRLPFLVYGN